MPALMAVFALFLVAVVGSSNESILRSRKMVVELQMAQHGYLTNEIHKSLWITWRGLTPHLLEVVVEDFCPERLLTHFKNHWNMSVTYVAALHVRENEAEYISFLADLLVNPANPKFLSLPCHANATLKGDLETRLHKENRRTLAGHNRISPVEKVFAS